MNVMAKGKILTAYFHVLIRSETLVYISLADCFECCNETKLIVTLLGLYICTSVIGYGQFVYKLAKVARGTARVNSVHMFIPQFLSSDFD
jgi:hypothetical protein